MLLIVVVFCGLCFSIGYFSKGETMGTTKQVNMRASMSLSSSALSSYSPGDTLSSSNSTEALSSPTPKKEKITAPPGSSRLTRFKYYMLYMIFGPSKNTLPQKERVSLMVVRLKWRMFWWRIDYQRILLLVYGGVGECHRTCLWYAPRDDLLFP